MFLNGSCLVAKIGFLRKHMVREATSIFAVWFCIVLLYGVLCLASNPVPDRVVDFVDCRESNFVVFLKYHHVSATLYHCNLFVMNAVR